MKQLIVKINKVVLLLTLSDIFTWGSFLVISSLSGIYLAERLGGNTVEFIGLGTGIYFVTRAIFQIPIGLLTDKFERDHDEIIVLAIGSILAGVPYLFYPLITQSWHYFILQFVFGIGVSLNLVTWRKLFTLNVNEGEEGKEYAFYGSAVSAVTAVISVILGIIANMGDKYFDTVMMVSGIIMILACIWILLIYKVQNRKSE